MEAAAKNGKKTKSRRGEKGKKIPDAAKKIVWGATAWGWTVVAKIMGEDRKKKVPPGEVTTSTPGCCRHPYKWTRWQRKGGKKAFLQFPSSNRSMFFWHPASPEKKREKRERRGDAV